MLLGDKSDYLGAQAKMVKHSWHYPLPLYSHYVKYLEQLRYGDPGTTLSLLSQHIYRIWLRGLKGIFSSTSVIHISAAQWAISRSRIFQF